MSGKEFLNNCVACGGNLAAMIMSGIHRCFPELYESMPDDKVYDLSELMQITEDCGVNWEEDQARTKGEYV